MFDIRFLMATASTATSASIVLPVANAVAQNGTTIEAIGKSGAVGILAFAMYKLIERMMRDHEAREIRHLDVIKKIDESSAERERNMQETIRNLSAKPCMLDTLQEERKKNV